MEWRRVGDIRACIAEGVVALVGWIATGVRGLGDQAEETRDTYREGREDRLPW